jgi:hypothetical protein
MYPQQPYYGQNYINYAIQPPPIQPIPPGLLTRNYPYAVDQLGKRGGFFVPHQRFGFNTNYLKSILAWLRILLIVRFYLFISQ